MHWFVQKGNKLSHTSIQVKTKVHIMLLFELHMFLFIQPLFLNLVPFIHYRPVLMFFPWRCIMNSILTLLLDPLDW